MASRPPLSTLLTMTSLLLTIPTLASADDDTETRKKIVACINKDITAANSEWKLASADLKKFTDIIDREIMKEPLVKKTPEEQRRILHQINDAARKELPSLSAETINKMLETLKTKAMHCVSLAKP